MSRIDLETGTRTEMTSGEGRVRSFTVERQSNGTRTHTDEAPDSTKDLLNLDRQVTAIERPGGETVSFDYDAGGRLASRTLPTRVTRYGYIASTGQLADIAGPDAIDLAFEWDGLLPKASTWSGPVSGRVGYRFDSNLWPIEETVNGEAVAFGYDADGLLIRAGALNLDRDAGNGLVTGATLDGIEETFAYNGFGEVIGRGVTVLGTPSFQVDYTRDPLGRITEQTETVAAASAATFAYTYDPAGRLTDVQRNGALTERYSYDANSNRATRTTSAGTTAYCGFHASRSPIPFQAGRDSTASRSRIPRQAGRGWRAG